MVQNVVQDERDLKASFEVTGKVIEQLLPDSHIGQDIRAGQRDLENGMHEGANFAEDEIGKLERHGLATKLDRTGQKLATFGGSAMSNSRGNRRSVEMQAGTVGRSVHHDLRQGKHSPPGRQNMVDLRSVPFIDYWPHRRVTIASSLGVLKHTFRSIPRKFLNDYDNGGVNILPNVR